MIDLPVDPPPAYRRPSSDSDARTLAGLKKKLDDALKDPAALERLKRGLAAETKRLSKEGIK